ncbi:histidinol-phosphate transaminase [Pectinatus frisingensis]|uniref:histidinol-phosphate transaminase n=1 Tax=Pectinatus frisingensis TaxID=865 RepID=UPI0015F52FAA|nr:histidinol-phosphate transaminase [Pectinatus frisingensis]
MLKYRTGIEKLPVYDVIERDWNIKLNANECNMNLPPIVEDRVMGRLSRLAFNRYPNTELESLAEQIAASFSVERNNILIANGSSEILEKLFFCFGGRNHKVVYPQPSFSMYKIYAALSNSSSIAFDLDEDYRFNAEKFVETVNENKAHLAVICAPNNPTGTHIPLADIEYVAKRINCAFVVDEAYIEFDGQSAVGLLAQYPHMIIARTFSKAYGLAGARVGYMLAATKITDIVGRVFMPYHVNVISAVVADIVYQMRHEYEPRIAMMTSERDRMSEQLRKLPGLTVYPSSTNFILLKYAKAVQLNEYLMNIGIGVRSFGNAPRLDNCIRVSMGTRQENDSFFKAAKEFVEQHDGE